MTLGIKWGTLTDPLDPKASVSCLLFLVWWVSFWVQSTSFWSSSPALVRIWIRTNCLPGESSLVSELECAWFGFKLIDFPESRTKIILVGTGWAPNCYYSACHVTWETATSATKDSGVRITWSWTSKFYNGLFTTHKKILGDNGHLVIGQTNRAKAVCQEKEISHEKHIIKHNWSPSPTYIP